MRITQPFKLAIIVVVLAVGCRKEEAGDPAPPADPPQATFADDPLLTDDQYTVLEASPNSALEPEDIILDNGLSVLATIAAHDPDWLVDQPFVRDDFDASSLTADEQRYLCLAKMMVVGDYLADDASHTHAANGAGQPACNGLRYGYGSRRYWERTTPRGPANPNSGTTCAPDPGCTTEQIYALDCSAMVYWVAWFAGLRFSVDENNANTTYLADTTHWNDAFIATGSDNYDELSVKAITGNLAVEEMQTGDVICWSGHIGVVLGQGSARYLYQSNGQPRLCPTSGTGCTGNDGDSRGPRLISMTQGQIDQFGGNYTVLRIGSGCPDAVEDFDGNSYPVVRVGDQCWCRENLRTTRFSNGDAIPEVVPDFDWEQATTPALSAYGNDVGNIADYGLLYNWYTVADPRNVCPAGWHVPTDQEWQTMEVELGMDPFEAASTGFNRGEAANVGGQLKAVSSLWEAPNEGANNSSGFSAVPGGFRTNGGPYNNAGFNTDLWTATEYDADNALVRELHHSVTWVSKFPRAKAFGCSVRCVRD